MCSPILLYRYLHSNFTLEIGAGHLALQLCAVRPCSTYRWSTILLTDMCSPTLLFNCLQSDQALQICAVRPCSTDVCNPTKLYRFVQSNQALHSSMIIINLCQRNPIQAHLNLTLDRRGQGIGIVVFFRWQTFMCFLDLNLYYWDNFRIRYELSEREWCRYGLIG